MYSDHAIKAGQVAVNANINKTLIGGPMKDYPRIHTIHCITVPFYASHTKLFQKSSKIAKFFL